MIAATIGKIFLQAYNRKFGKHYDARTFFIEKHFPLFFDHEKYMQWVTNSPFVQGIKKGVAPTIPERQEKLNVLIRKIEQSEADASIAIGFPSLDLTATTSGQITNLRLPVSQEDVYLSWIGSALGVGVQGGISILFDREQILMDLYEGWEIYRNYLERMPKLRGNQINTWNGQWLAHRYGTDFIEEDPLVGLDPFTTTKEGIEVVTQSWTKILLSIARKQSGVQMMGYVYNLRQTNTTVGFIPFVLPQIRKPSELYSKLFGMAEIRKAEPLFGTAQGFLRSCQLGTIGVEALEPKGIREYMEKGKMPRYDAGDEEKRISFNTYQIWILAMLNNEELWVKAQEIARLLYVYTLGDKNAKTKKTNEVKDILKSTSKKTFITALEMIVPEVEDKEAIGKAAELIHFMPVDNVPYFLTLIRFQYALISNQ